MAWVGGGNRTGRHVKGTIKNYLDTYAEAFNIEFCYFLE